MLEECAIRVTDVHKNFVLHHQRVSSLKSVFTNLLRKESASDTIQKALSGVSFELDKGEFFGIVGRNGSGKSTLLKMIAGIYQPTEGDIKVHGKLVPFIELGVGFNPELTGRENVYLNGALLGFTVKEIDAQYEDIVEFAELEQFMDQKLKNYSSGMQVRLAFSCATRARADILLVDEVLAVGDADFQRKCFNYFRLLKRQKKTVVFVTHDMNSVREFCDRAILINEGKVAFSGTAADAAREYTRLFTETSVEEKKSAYNVATKKWGNGDAVYTSIKVSRPEGGVKLSLSAKAIRNVTNPVFGFVIKNAAGEQILGSNNIVKKQPFGALSSGRKYKVEWEFPDILSDGRYVVDVAITQDDGATVCQWWEEAGAIEVKKDEKTPYPVNPNISLKIS